MSKSVKLKPVFDPKKNYRWEPTDIFEITGQQFASIYHLLSQEMNTSGGAPLALTVEAYNVVMDIFRSGVSSEVITEANAAEISRAEEDNVKQLFK
jgi:hypothetical protein